MRQEKNITYTIRTPQKNLSVLAPGLDIKDAAILTYLINLANSDSDKIEWFKNKIKFFNFETHDSILIKFFFWADFKTVGRKMPLLKLNSSSAIKQRILKLQRHGFLVRRLYKRYMPIIYLGDKCNLCWVKELENECRGCKKFCEAGCPIYDSVKPETDVLKVYFRKKDLESPSDPTSEKSVTTPPNQAQGRGCDV